MKIKRFFWCYVMAFVAILCGLIVTIIAQDAQDLQNQERVLQKEIALDAERIKVLQAEWSYLTRPNYLQKIINQVEPDAKWMIIKGKDIVAASDLVQSIQSQLAMAESTDQSQSAEEVVARTQ